MKKISDFKITATTTFNDVMKNKAEVVGDKIFLTYIRDFDKGLDEKYTYRDLHLYSNRLANGLSQFGLKAGVGLSLMEINSPEFLLTLFATWKLGGYAVLINTALKGVTLQYIFDHSDSQILVIHWSMIDAYLDIKDQLPKIKHVIVEMNEAPADFKLPEGMISFQELMKSPDDDIEAEINFDEKCYLMYTSGTTGPPKATTFFYKKTLAGNALQTASGLIRLFLGGEDNVMFTCLPLFHGNALQITTLPGYFTETPVVLSKRFSASRHWDICRKYNVTTFNLLGAMPQFLLKQPERPNDSENKVKLIVSAACPKEMIIPFEKRFNVEIKEFYGAVDGGGYILGPFFQKNVPVGSMGKPLGGTKADIMDEEGNLLRPDEIGELVFLVNRGELEMRKVTYYKDESSTKEKIREAKDGNLWLHTGDLATKDADGWFYFVDRKKDSIRRRGENISPWSIERVINQYDKVLESAAYAVQPEGIVEDEVMVSVVLKPGEKLTPEELLDYCQGKMAYFMVPRFINFIDALPKSEVHRTLKEILRDKGVTETTYDREAAGYKVKK
ncbi:MAG: AMP-binding protein [Candidatus Thorarchaeota archaeon]